MPTPDTFLLAKADALRRLPTQVSQDLQAAEVEYGQRMGRGVVDTLRSYLHPIQYLKDSYEGAKQFIKHPVDSTKAIASALKQPEVQGSMIVPDPLKLIKALKGTKALHGPTSNIIVPEALALPEELDDLYAAKKFGIPESEVGWFKGPKGIYFKEEVPITLKAGEEAKIRLTPEGRDWGSDRQPDELIEWDHPNLDRRAREQGLTFDAMPEVYASNIPDELMGVYYPGIHKVFVNRYKMDKSGVRKLNEVVTHELGHGIQEIAGLPPALRGTSPGQGVSTFRYLTQPGEASAQVAALRDLAPAAYRRMISYMDDYNAYIARIQRLKDSGQRPRMPGPGFLYDRIEEVTDGKVGLDDLLDK